MISCQELGHLGRRTYPTSTTSITGSSVLAANWQVKGVKSGMLPPFLARGFYICRNDSGLPEDPEETRKETAFQSTLFACVTKELGMIRKPTLLGIAKEVSLGRG